MTIISKVFPIGSKRRKIIKKIRATTTHKKQISSVDYSAWIKKIEPELFRKTQNELKKIKYKPKISIVVPAYNTPDKYLTPLIKSVTDQIYENWELVLADGSDKPERAMAISSQTKKDRRIVYKKVSENKGIVGNTNFGIRHATGEFIAFLDHDDLLNEFALAEVAIVLNENSQLDLVYSDEDKITDNGQTRLLPFFKPDWSPELLLSVNYITHFVVARKKIAEQVGLLRDGFDGAQDYDFLLRFTEKTDRIKHIPKILYHWRLADGSTAGNVGNKSYADDAGQRALKDYVKRNKLNAKVLPVPERPTNYRLKFNQTKESKVSVIIPFKDKPELLEALTKSIFSKTTYKNYELILVSNNSVEEKTKKLLKKLVLKSNVIVVEYNHPFNYSAVNNYGRKYATGDVLVFINNDMLVINGEWLDELSTNALRKNIGVVGGWLTYPDGTTQHTGVILGMGGMAGHVLRNRNAGEFTEFGMPDWSRNYLAVTGACQAMEAKLFDEVGGYDEEFIICGSDVALCLSIYEKGYQNIYCPYVRLTHFESKSVISYENIPPGDYDHSLVYYKSYLESGDPYFNKNLDYMNEQVALRINK